MNKSEVLYPYGFIFSDVNIINLPPRYSKMDIGKYFYYYDRILPPCISWIDQKFLIIHGHFVYSGFDPDIKNESLAENLLKAYLKNKNNFLDLIDFIGGRYIIITGDKEDIDIYPDASGARSAYYLTDQNVISSHLNLIVDNFLCKKDDLLGSYPKMSCNFNWTMYENIERIVPNISLNLITKSSNRFFPRKENVYKKLSEAERFDIAERLWKDQLNYYKCKYENLVFSLTGGCDSRVSLAMAKDIRHDIRFFTYTIAEKDDNVKSYFENSLTLDKEIVEKILADIPLNHDFLVFNSTEFKPNALEKIVASKNSVISHGKYLVEFYNKKFPQTYVMHLRSNLLEIGRAFYMNITEANEIDAVKQVFYKTVFKQHKHTLSKQEQENLISEGLSTLQYSNILDYHILDLFYWENRMGGWFSEVLNETDSAFDTFLPFNMRAIIDISLSFSLMNRKSDYFFRELINRNFSILNFYGINSKLNCYESNRQSVIENRRFFDKFTIFDSVSESFEDIYVNKNCISIPTNFLNVDSFAELKLIYQEPSGGLNIELISEYISKKGKGYLRYELYKNENLMLSEDMSSWNHSNHINLMDMVRGDVLKLRVVVLKTCRAKSWEIASRLYIKNYKEFDLINKSGRSMTYTSPFSN